MPLQDVHVCTEHMHVLDTVVQTSRVDETIDTATTTARLGQESTDARLGQVGRKQRACSCGAHLDSQPAASWA